MAKKIKAYIDAPVIDPPDLHTKLIASVVAAPFVGADPVRCVTLVVHDSGKHERVFTESEVAELLKDVGLVTDAKHRPEWLVSIARRHGIAFDPA